MKEQEVIMGFKRREKRAMEAHKPRFSTDYWCEPTADELTVLTTRRSGWGAAQSQMSVEAIETLKQQQLEKRRRKEEMHGAEV
jgi:hypothetical protein